MMFGYYSVPNKYRTTEGATKRMERRRKAVPARPDGPAGDAAGPSPGVRMNVARTIRPAARARGKGRAAQAPGSPAVRREAAAIAVPVSAASGRPSAKPASKRLPPARTAAERKARTAERKAQAAARKAEAIAAARAAARAARQARAQALAEQQRTVRVKALDPVAKCGPATSVRQLYRVDESMGGTVRAHLVFLDHHGWYCIHGRDCRAVRDARRFGRG